MPTVTYENLPPEKKDRILTAVRAEVTRVPYDQVSINRIVQQADISRGSFYMYFSGKEELYWLLLDKFIGSFQKILLESFGLDHPDLVESVLNLFEQVCCFGKKHFNQELFKNLFEFVSSRLEPDEFNKRFDVDQLQNELFRRADFLTIRKLSLTEKKTLFLLLKDIIQSALKDLWVAQRDYQETYELLKRKTQLILLGLTKGSV